MSKILKILIENWWVATLRGVGSIIFGILVLSYPELTVFILLNLFTAYSFLNGGLMAFLTIRSISHHRAWPPFLIMAVAHFAAAALCLVLGNIAAVGLFLLIGPWAVVTGILQIFVALRAKHEKRGVPWLIYGGIASLIFAAMLAIQPFMGFKRFEWLIGVYATVHGVFFILDSLGFRSLNFSSREQL